VLDRRFWTLVLLAVLSVVAINGLVGTPKSPLWRAVGVSHPPTWLPFALAAAIGLGFGVAFSRPRAGGSDKKAADDEAGRAPRVPRHLRRQAEREARRKTARPGGAPPRTPVRGDLPPRGERRRARRPSPEPPAPRADASDAGGPGGMAGEGSS
jgi:hypothetical protein